MTDLDLERVLHRMSVKGLRITEQRRTLIHLFMREPFCLSTKEIILGLERKHPGLSYDTVYRNLRTLVEIGLLEQFLSDGKVKFRLMNSRDEAQHLMICLTCKEQTPLDCHPISEMKLPSHFQAVSQKLEVYGYCYTCQK
ncbi:Fur family transcriptional regulator [Paenibacillus sedimenti]|uniref:Transcriptional repressor n=1 Tax=Paenibacillus sedimenti TaxID=2770274 RepID=A0A926KT20_9BACL|nr:transcriptional repressor [Paenibacillus sedimenti]MBD0382987.1 transcriptional repressor [Paenibacillus sedimenti]